MTAIFVVPEGLRRRPSAAGMKAHIGVYNVHDSHLLPKLLHDHEAKACVDSAYQGKGEHDPCACAA
jgi:hypothetical protein